MHGGTFRVGALMRAAAHATPAGCRSTYATRASMNMAAMRRKVAHFTASEWAKPRTLVFRITQLSACYASASEWWFLSCFASDCKNVHTGPCTMVSGVAIMRFLRVPSKR
jgi:hypothetical protein